LTAGVRLRPPPAAPPLSLGGASRLAVALMGSRVVASRQRDSRAGGAGWPGGRVAGRSPGGRVAGWPPVC